MGELTAAIVHEVSQPLTVIRSNAQVGLRLLAAGDPDLKELGEILEDIVAADQRADQVIQHVRALLRKGEAERRPLPLNTLISDVISVVASDAARRNVAIVLDLAPGLPLVSGDRVQLQQVLLNLMMNAFDAMTEGGARPPKPELILRTRPLGDDGVQVDVADTGPGIPPATLGSIFKPFVTTKPNGMGMGLSVSHSIVRAHEGRLWAENDPEGGAVFHIVLPTLPGEGRVP
jgi:two-component system sensor kinase FixL